jgi:DNA-binding response OmpR family regulator
MELKGKSIMIVEDDHNIRNLIKVYLENSGYETFEASDGKEAMDTFLKVDPCFLVVDLMLPYVSGEELTQWIRKEQKSEIPIIMVTAKTAEADRIGGLKAGADDYMTKPFSPAELVARVEAVLRRTAHRCNKISYNGLTLKPFKREASYDGSKLSLTPNELLLLSMFMRHSNQVLTREQLLDELYPLQEKVVVDRTIDVHIANLREKLRKKSGKTFIRTVRGVGYQFEAL